MVRVGKLADYGTVAMSYIARDPEGIHPAANVADAIRVAGPTVRKILKLLARDGLLVSLRGAGGGYRLALRPDRISVARVIEAVEGPLALTECSGTAGRCAQEPSCPIGSHWQRINRDMRKMLESVTLADMIRPARPRPDPAAASMPRIAAKAARAAKPGRVSRSTNRGGNERFE